MSPVNPQYIKPFLTGLRPDGHRPAMPLSELPSGHIGRNGPMQELNGNPPIGSSSSKNPDFGAQHGFMQTPSSIQSMLKNTTETGDIGQFCIKPARVPSMGHRTPKSPSMAQAAYNKKRHVGGHYHEHRDNIQNPMDLGGAEPSATSTSYSHNQRLYKYRMESAGKEEGERSYSMTQSSITSQSFSQRPSPTDFHLQGQEGIRSSRPRSPFAYPTRLKRPGYRPSSPALSDYNKPGLGTHMPPSRAASFRTASPLSIYTSKRVPHAWQQNVNRSDPMLRYYAPSPRHDEYGEALSHSPRMPLSLRPNGLPSMRSSTPTQFSDVSISRRTSPSPPPAFYDYTESFEDNHYHSVSTSSFSLAEQVIPEDTPRMYHELDADSARPKISELSAYSSSVQGLAERPAQLLPQRQESVKIIRKAVPSSSTPDAYAAYSKVVTAGGEGRKAEVVDRGEGRKVNTDAPRTAFFDAPVSGTAHREGPEPSEESRADEEPASDETQVPSASNDSLMSTPSSSSSNESMYSLMSSSQKDPQPPALDLTAPSEAMSPSPGRSQIPLIQQKNYNTVLQNLQLQPADVSRGASFDGKSDTTDRTEIISPTPERAASSLNSRNRFSRILSLDEDLADVHKFTTKSKRPAITHRHDHGNDSKTTKSFTDKCRSANDVESGYDVLHNGAKAAKPDGNVSGRRVRHEAPTISKGSLNLPLMQIPRRSSSRSLNTAVTDKFAEPTIPPRRSSFMRKPAYHLFEPPTKPPTGLSTVSKDLDRIVTLTRQSPREVASISSTMKQLPPLPAEPTDVTSLTPVDQALINVNSAPNVSTGNQKGDTLISELESLAVPILTQSAEISTNPNEFPALASLNLCTESSTTVAELPTELPAATIHTNGIQVSEDRLEREILADPEESYGNWKDQYGDINASKTKQTIDKLAHKAEPTTAPPLELSEGTPATPHEPKKASCSAVSSLKLSESDEKDHPGITKYKLKVRADRDSSPSLHPWNLETSYPWADISPKLDVTMPQESKASLEQSVSGIPRFKLKLHRASSITTGTTKITKPRPSLDSHLHANINASNDLFHNDAHGRKPRPSITIGQENSSQSPHLQTRFKESFEQSPATFAISPTITLVPPSPGLNLEARSFFSDDSSTRNRGSLRKRLSQLRAMASRNTMSEDGRSIDRGILRSRASGRVSKQSVRTVEGTPQFKAVRSKVVEKIKGWLLRGSEKVRGLWGSRTDRDPNDFYVAR